MTVKVLDEYFENRSYYQIDQNTQMDNPDQRIAQDLTTFTSKLLLAFPFCGTIGCQRFGLVGAFVKLTLLCCFVVVAFEFVYR